ncbi:MAG TPA: hypothetical protein VFC10_10265 [Terriglobia bacterium]|jgi:hypothetical protein|nr:hypothetical protein [Terriglobia bacterium]
MLPSEIKPDLFKEYPPLARQVATSHIELFRRLPLAFAPLILQQLQEYDWKFPAERREIDHQLSFLASSSEAQIAALVSGFEQLKLSRHLERFDWVNSPGVFSQQLSAHLWATHQIDAFRSAAQNFMEKVNAAIPPEQLPTPRLGIAVIGKDVKQNDYPLFRKLRPYGMHFTRVDPSNALRTLLNLTAERAKAHPVAFGHWYVDGGPPETVPQSPLTVVSYSELKPVREALLQKITKAIHGGIGGPEALTSMLFKMRPEEIGLSGKPEDAVLTHFETNILTQGQGTQIFSTTFVQWTTRELWRRAQPLTILARFAPRQQQRPMNELLSGKDENLQPDPRGSLIDADMGAFLMWIDQQRLSGASEASFLVWFEDHTEALAVSPFLPRNTETDSPVDMERLLSEMGLKENSDKKPSSQAPPPSAELHPTQSNYILDRIDNNLDSVDFLNGAEYGDAT